MKIKSNLIDFTTPKVMGILNLNDNSFYEKSRLNSEKELLHAAEKMILEGASILDLGAQSTRPGSAKLSTAQEVEHISKAINSLSKAFPDTLISVDTFQSEVALAAIDSGAQMINDISGLSFDEKLLSTIKSHSIYYVLMHIRGNFETMHSSFEYENIIQDVIDYFREKITLLSDFPNNQLILDPGFGFSKSVEQNFELFHHLEQLQVLNHPVMVGISRKSMIYKKLRITAEESLNGTIALNAIALMKDAKILRVHDVKEAVEIIKLVS